MHIPIVLAFVVLQCTLCLNIRVPVDWSNDSEVNKNEQLVNAVKNEGEDTKPIPKEYFQYLAKKPQFAIDIAADNGVQSPENLYKPHPIRPYTGLPNVELGEKRVQDSEKIIHSDQGSVQNDGSLNYVNPATTSFEIHHPYKSEEPAVQQLYNDPILNKLRNNLRDVSHNVEKYQNEAGKLNVQKEEYSESPEEIDHKKVPEKSSHAEFEVHKPQRRPVYYKYPPTHQRLIVNHKLKHPWNQNIAKVHPNHYRPIQNHLHTLRQQQALKYDNENNHYPQLPPKEDEDSKPEGYDIYEKGKATFEKIKDNAENKINKYVQEQRPIRDENNESSKEYVNQDDTASNVADEEEFIPVKNYAQVRKTETTKHLPREAALEDAENFEEIQNAPRLREAIKSKKAQIVYSEEGYEDSAYDHGGEQKHASDHERHGGYLKQNEVSKGKFKTPSFIANHKNVEGSEHRDEILHGKKWDNDVKENEDENESDYYESQEENFDNSELGAERSHQNDRNKRNSEDIIEKLHINDNEKNIKGSETQKNIENITDKSSTVETDLKSVADNNIKQKYPYYFQDLQLLSKNSPIRYAENLDLIPKKTDGGSEFYDSRAKFECPEVEDNINPLPEKLNKDGHPDEPDENSESLSDDNAKDDAKFSSLKNNQRLKGLGDKIDCFKAKYFGENPLDSPFFKEDIIENPEPVTKPNLEIFYHKHLVNLTKDMSLGSSHLFTVLDKLRNNQSLKENSQPSSNILVSSLLDENINVSEKANDSVFSNISSTNNANDSLAHMRKKRATHFTYEPYKIIRDSQIPDSKKTTTTSNISPLIKQLQSSRVIDKVISSQDKDHNLKKAKQKIYKNIGKDDRQENNNNSAEVNPSFVDVNSDQRRGEPRYEIRTSQNKPPIEHKQHKKNSQEKNAKTEETTTQTLLKRSKRRKTTSRPYFDVSQYLPQSIETQQTAASNTVRKVIRTTTLEPTSKLVHRLKFDKNINNEKEYDDYNEEEEDTEEDIKPSTTTAKPRKRTRGTTTIKPIEIENASVSPKLRLVTRFREYQPEEKNEPVYETTESSSDKPYENEHKSPKYTEKQKKSSKSTLVTDTKSYGGNDDDDDEITKKEVDDMIGVKQDMEEYLPLYERVVNKIKRMKNEDLNKKHDHNYDSEVNIYDDDKYAFTEDDNDDDDDDEEDNDEDDNDESDSEDDIADADEEGEKSYNNKSSENANGSRLEVTTSEPTKRTLAKTTEAPATTTELRRTKIDNRPIISKKKVEIHKELPINTSSPHISQFKQDIKEIEITKELRPKSKIKPNKNIEALDIYRDDKLAEEINKLSDVEIFRENLDLESGPKHGGNYRSITPEELEKEASLQASEVKNKDDVETSQTETRKIIEVDKDVPLKRRVSYNGRQNPQKNAKFIELRDAYDSKPGPLHGGNLKLPQNRNQRRNGKSEKYVDIDDDEDEDEPSSMHGGNFKSYGDSGRSGREMHGGNYRSEKLVEPDEEKRPHSRSKSKDTRVKAVSSTAVPYILDPSKRMYYYVDA